MKIKPKANCPLDGFQPCRQLDCAWFTQVRGRHPQTGEEIDEWGCAISWLPVMLIENAKESRQVGAAVESFRNEMVRANETAAAQPVLQLLGMLGRARVGTDAAPKSLPAQEA